MNPETKLTDAEIKAICSRHGIAYKHHARITTGFSHEVHRLNDDLIIKIFNTYDKNDKQRFTTESAVLSSNLPIKKPRMIASVGGSDIIDRSYILMSYVAGKPLGSVWHLATATQREALIKEICDSLRLINKIIPAELGLAEVESWQTIIKNRGEALVAQLKSKTITDPATAEKALRTLHTSEAIFKDNPLFPVYWDIHFDNFIVNEDFKLQAIIDLENVELAALDYPLFVVQKQTDEPEKYFSEENEKYADKKDYEKLKSWYQLYYPEMFAGYDDETRLKMYQLLDTLRLLVDWYHVKELHTKLELLIR